MDPADPNAGGGQGEEGQGGQEGGWQGRPQRAMLHRQSETPIPSHTMILELLFRKPIYKDQNEPTMLFKQVISR